MPLGQRLLDVPIGQAVAEVPADRDRDHLRRNRNPANADRSTCDIGLSAIRTFTVRASRKLDLPSGTVVKVGLSKSAEQAVELVGSPTDLDPDPVHDDLLEDCRRRLRRHHSEPPGPDLELR